MFSFLTVIFVALRRMMPGAVPIRGPPGQGGGPRQGTTMRGPMGRGDYGKRGPRDCLTFHPRCPPVVTYLTEKTWSLVCLLVK